MTNRPETSAEPPPAEDIVKTGRRWWIVSWLACCCGFVEVVIVAWTAGREGIGALLIATVVVSFGLAASLGGLIWPRRHNGRPRWTAALCGLVGNVGVLFLWFVAFAMVFLEVDARALSFRIAAAQRQATLSEWREAQQLEEQNRAREIEDRVRKKKQQ